jgi:hypothetical protein
MSDLDVMEFVGAGSGQQRPSFSPPHSCAARGKSATPSVLRNEHLVSAWTELEWRGTISR